VIVGYNDMQSMLESVGTLFHEAHPRVTLRLNLPGTATAASALSLGQSALAAMGAEFSDREMASFVALNGVAPIRVRIAHCSMNPSARSAPVGIYVNAANPIAKMTTTQVARIFTTGNPDGDISMWSQMTADPAWKGRAIHPCGIAEEAAAGLSPFMLSRMGRRPYTLIFSAFAQSRDAVRCVAEDPSAIAFASANIRDPKTRLLAIATSTGGPFWVPSTDNIRSGHYPYDRFLYVYLKQSKGKVSDNLAREYLCIVLSSSGQAAIGAAAPGYVPLSESERREERAKLE
jgi:phosphate transport system substrate-binding protein